MKSVHYVDYGHDFDKWIPVNEIIITSPFITPVLVSDGSLYDLTISRFCIRESLKLNRKMDAKIALNHPKPL